MKDTANRDNLSEEHLRIFTKLADVLIPRTKNMPSASEVDAAGRWLNRVLASRPDLVAALRHILNDASQEAPETFILRLEHELPESFATLLSAVAGSYYMSEEVRERLGYGGQRRLHPDPHHEARIESLVRPVVQRGQIYRNVD